MLELLDSIQDIGWIMWVRDANTVLGYATVLAFHTFGMILVVGISTAIALRTLGVASDVPIAPLRKYVPLMWIGFFVNLGTGLVLFFQDGRKFATSYDYWIKMFAVVGAVTTTQMLLTYLRDPAVADMRPVPSKGRTLAGAVLFCWSVAVTAGRLSAYDPFIQTQSAVAVVIVMIVLVLALKYLMPRLFAVDNSAQ